MITSGSYDHSIKIWDANTGEVLKTLIGHSSCVNTVAFSPDGKLIASGSDDNTIRIWDADAGQILDKLQGHTSSIRSIAFSPDGKSVASGSDDHTIRVWKLERPSPLARLLYEFDPVEVADALEFIWNLKLDGLQFVENLPALALFPQKAGYYITWYDHTEKYRSLLDAPNPDETKMDQLVRWLEKRKAYRKKL